jgi:signal transduction histidine kinase
MKENKQNTIQQSDFLKFVGYFERKQRLIVHYLQNEINQEIITAKLNNDLLTKNASNKKYSQKLAKSNRIILDHVFNDIYHISSTIYPIALDDIGLENAVNDLLRKYYEGDKTKISFKSFIIPTGLPHTMKICIFRIIEELIDKLSDKSSSISIHLSKMNSDVKMIINFMHQGDKKIFNLSEIEDLLSGLENFVNLLGGKTKVTLFSRNNFGINIIIPVTEE